ncbi:NAD-dependent deacetylase [Candidatus Competibacter denitrificans Run_A_D11]|uniref:NAD-dependent protein deacylase n=1 Tax=Candidatus Competibacter denitrificans Run_A_D11 TaxID=1400863 RepID=W6M3K1_9GAMM|nr:NAD-dependent deacylase [Candidatus Competibacter denitrificans]CDI02291.1 NAD-dependent deacetylase [Candidatus Competibacter denitrificans Run_A_D11]HAS86592.1 NAD-dependent deacylase [Candidatus Competibacteraceae bacterium]HRC69561.1 NAD-dependent deacylase [Candidatus Competibacter denitrificans]
MREVPIPSELVNRLRHARQVAVLTGAGVSAESGVPTFREAQTGLWAQYDPQELATPEAFRRNPKLVWEWYAWRQERIRQAEPHAGHRALVTMEQQIPEFSLITQNVDGLHRRAGSHQLVELHGNIFRAKCFSEDRPVENWSDDGEIPPRCPRCGGLLRPDVVWFGEALPAAALHTAQHAARTTEIFFSIGTSTLVYPAADLPFVALGLGATVVEINPQPTPLSPHVTFSLTGAAGEILPALVNQTWEAA